MSKYSSSFLVGFNTTAVSSFDFTCFGILLLIFWIKFFVWTKKLIQKVRIKIPKQVKSKEDTAVVLKPTEKEEEYYDMMVFKGKKKIEEEKHKKLFEEEKTKRTSFFEMLQIRRSK
jgi:hypothetical protein